MDLIAECIFPVAFDSRHAVLGLFSSSKLMLTLITSLIFLLLVPNVKVSLEGEELAGRNQMMEGTPLSPFLSGTFGFRR